MGTSQGFTMNRVASSLVLIIVGCAIVYALPTISSGSALDSIIPEDSQDSEEIEFIVPSGEEVTAAANKLEGKAAEAVGLNAEIAALQWNVHWRGWKNTKGQDLGANSPYKALPAANMKDPLNGENTYKPNFGQDMTDEAGLKYQTQLQKWIPELLQKYQIDFADFTMMNGFAKLENDVGKNDVGENDVGKNDVGKNLWNLQNWGSKVDPTPDIPQNFYKDEATKANYMQFYQRCGSDTARLVYNAAIWEPVTTVNEQAEAALKGNTKVFAKMHTFEPYTAAESKNLTITKTSGNAPFGCLAISAVRGVPGGYKGDRSTITKLFQRIGTKEHVIVTAAHFPHPGGGTGNDFAKGFVREDLGVEKRNLGDHLGATIAKIKERADAAKLDVSRIVSILDTNFDVPLESTGNFWDGKHGEARPNEETAIAQHAARQNAINVVIGQKNKEQLVAKEKKLVLGPFTIAPWAIDNQEPQASSEDVWKYVTDGNALLKNMPIQSTDPVPTCCADKTQQFDAPLFPYAFDRIWSTGAEKVQTIANPFATKEKEQGKMIMASYFEKHPELKKLLMGCLHLPIIGKITPT